MNPKKVLSWKQIEMCFSRIIKIKKQDKVVEMFEE